MGPDADLTIESDVIQAHQACMRIGKWMVVWMIIAVTDLTAHLTVGEQEIGLSILLRQDQLGCLFLQ